MGNANVVTKIEGRVAVVTIDHPPQNTINTAILKDIAREVAQIERDPNVRSVLLTTANGVPPFAADAAGLLENLSWERQYAMVLEGQRALTQIELSKKPIVFAVYDGMCMGGGLELVLACHLRVAGTKSIFAVPEAPAGAMPGWGNTQRLARLVGRTRGLELALTGVTITAQELLALGALNRVVPGDTVLTSARELAESIAQMRSRSLESILAAFNTHYLLGMAEGKATELERYMEIFEPKTFVAAVTALFEQRRITFDD